MKFFGQDLEVSIYTKQSRPCFC